MLAPSRQPAVLQKLARDHLEGAFHLVPSCLPLDYDTAGQANLPLWRDRSDRAASEQSGERRTAVYRTAAEILVQHAAIPERTIYAADEGVEGLPEAEAARAWPSVAAWAASESCSKGERTRLVRYLTSFADGVLSQCCREGGLKRVRGVLEQQSAFPVVAPDLWIFANHAVIRDHRPDDAGWENTEDGLDRKRLSALRGDWESGGVQAILSLVHEVGNTRFLVGMASRVLPRDEIKCGIPWRRFSYRRPGPSH